MVVKQPSPSRKKSSKLRLLLPLFIVLLAVVGYLAKNYLVVAVVNGQPISRLAFVKELERQSGKKVLDSLITKTLILQEAKKQNFTVSEDQIDAELEKIESELASQNQNLDQLLALQGLDRSQLREEIRLQKIVEGLAGTQISIEESEIDAYLDQNKDFLPTDLSDEELRNLAEQQLRQEKLRQRVTDWLDSLRQNAQIQYYL